MSQSSERLSDSIPENMETLRNVNENAFALNAYLLKINQLHDSLLNYENVIENLQNKNKSLNEDISELRNENQMLRDKLLNSKINFLLKLQQKQADHEIKSKKTFENIDVLLKDMNRVTVSSLSDKIYYENERFKSRLKEKYESQILRNKKNFEKLIVHKENEYQTTIEQIKQFYSKQIKDLEQSVEEIFEALRKNLKNPSLSSSFILESPHHFKRPSDF